MEKDSRGICSISLENMAFVLGLKGSAGDHQKERKEKNIADRWKTEKQPVCSGRSKKLDINGV